VPRKYNTPRNQPQPVLFPPESGWVCPRIADLPSWKGQARVGFDVETRDPQLSKLGPGVRRDAYIVGYSFAFEDGRKFYVPIRHAVGNNVEGDALGWLQNQAKHFDGELVGANLQYDLDFAAEVGVAFPKVKFFRDVQVAEPLIDENHFNFSLNSIAERRGHPLKNEDLLIEAAELHGYDPKTDLWKLPAKFVGPYGEDDAFLPLKILQEQEKDIAEENLGRVWNVESEVLPVLVKMRRRGVAIDWDHLARLKADYLQQEALNCARIKEHTGINFGIGDCNKDKAVLNIFKYLGITPNKTEKGNPKTDAATLSAIGEVPTDCLVTARRFNKLRTTFVASIERHETNGRIHCSFEQLKRQDEEGSSVGTISGRLSSRNPNLQQQPTRGKISKSWRQIYIPDDGGLWACNDYSQQEPRLLVHFAEKVPVAGGPVAAQIYRDDPDADNHTMMTRLIHGKAYDSMSAVEREAHRKNAKTIFLGLCYGMQGAKLAISLGLPTAIKELSNGRRVPIAGEEAQVILDQFNSKVPYVLGMFNMAKQRANNVGHIRTLLGRRSRFPLDEHGNRNWTYKALNRLIQGSAADQTKAAMVQADRAGFNLQLQVHDELDLTVEHRQEAEELATIMREAIPVNVPMKVDVEIGPNWGEVS
jgi:DNA polymerase I-like protein with 3'-5' exonuclease and polymerase domains